MKALLLLAILLSVSCTRANMSQWASLGSEGHIVCRSGGQVFLDTWSTGKISTEKQSDGWYFEEKGTGKLIRVSGDCVITN